MMFAKSLVKFKQLNIDLENVEQNHMTISFGLCLFSYKTLMEI